MSKLKWDHVHSYRLLLTFYFWNTFATCTSTSTTIHTPWSRLATLALWPSCSAYVLVIQYPKDPYSGVWTWAFFSSLTNKFVLTFKCSKYKTLPTQTSPEWTTLLTLFFPYAWKNWTTVKKNVNIFILNVTTLFVKNDMYNQ